MNFDNDPIEVVTPYTYEDSKAFLRYHSRRSAHYGYVVLLAYGIVVATNMVTLSQIGSYVWGGLIVMSAGFLILVSRGTLLSRNVYERTHKNVARGFRYLFKNDEVVLINLLTADDEDVKRVSQGRQLKETPEPGELEPEFPTLILPRGWNILPYNNIVKIAETKDAYYLYVNRNIAFIVTKVGFVTGKTYNFDSLMEQKLGSRFKQMKSRD